MALNTGEIDPRVEVHCGVCKYTVPLTYIPLKVEGSHDLRGSLNFILKHQTSTYGLVESRKIVNKLK